MKVKNMRYLGEDDGKSQSPIRIDSSRLIDVCPQPSTQPCSHPQVATRGGELQPREPNAGMRSSTYRLCSHLYTIGHLSVFIFRDALAEMEGPDEVSPNAPASAVAPGSSASQLENHPPDADAEKPPPTDAPSMSTVEAAMGADSPMTEVE